MKILHVAPSFAPSTAYGGATHSTSRLCGALGALGLDVRVVTTDADGRRTLSNVLLNQEVESKDVKITYFERQFRESIALGLLKELPKAIAWADVVHLMAVYSFPTWPTLALCKRFGKPLVWSPRGALQRYAGTHRLVGKALFEQACRVLAPSRLIFHVTSVEEKAQTEARWAHARARIVPNGVDLPTAVPAKRPHELFELLYLGRLDPQKGLENLLTACTQLRLERPWRLTIAGAGETDYERGLRSLAESSRYQGSVRFLGAVHGDAKEKAFADADLLVAPSHMESFCISVAEALAHGVPVIASRGTPWKDVVSHDCGLWVNNQPASLAESIRAMTTRPLEEMGQKGRSWMASEFTWQKSAEKMKNVYDEVWAA